MHGPFSVARNERVRPPGQEVDPKTRASALCVVTRPEFLALRMGSSPKAEKFGLRGRILERPHILGGSWGLSK